MDVNKIKYAVLWLLMLSMALPFSACAGNPPAPARSEESSGPESAPPDSGTAEPTADTRFPVVRGGKAVPIVYPMDDLDAMGYAKTVANKIKSLTGVDAECREDSRRVDEAIRRHQQSRREAAATLEQKGKRTKAKRGHRNNG